ncbi:MAG: substrate-binding domain-containing protein [Chloroflexota bacterium]|nr:substrate-binding domain-containing protein [Chloroflexota bacterium]
MPKKLSTWMPLIAVLCIAAWGCSSNDKAPTATTGPSASATSAPPQPTKASGTLILATTSSTQDSGLLDVLVPAFEKETGYTVKTVAVGSGQAIAQASRGDADVVLVHSPAAEKQMVDAGDGIERTLVMHNDFIIVGPKADPACVKAATTTNEAMSAIATKQAQFISRGDNSGTNAFELKIWQGLNITPKGMSWYAESGQNMGATLQIASQKAAYTISDRATYLAQKKNLELDILFQKDKALLNVYHVIIVNPAKHGNTNVTAARAFASYLVRADVQETIGKFGIDTTGEQLFVPDAGKPEPTG